VTPSERSTLPTGPGVPTSRMVIASYEGADGASITSLPPATTAGVPPLARFHVHAPGGSVSGSASLAASALASASAPASASGRGGRGGVVVDSVGDGAGGGVVELGSTSGA